MKMNVLRVDPGSFNQILIRAKPFFIGPWRGIFVFVRSFLPVPLLNNFNNFFVIMVTIGFHVGSRFLSRRLWVCCF